MVIKKNIDNLRVELGSASCRLIAVSKTQPVSLIKQAYDAGQRVFGENKAQEMAAKHKELPADIAWHMIGHLQTNKVKYIAPFVALIHSVDSEKLLEEINKQALKKQPDNQMPAAGLHCTGRNQVWLGNTGSSNPANA
ncbi:MAG: pyridoxal phosphate enzyme, YggS family [Bacteroidetes bacterium OLB12]|nr:MAG: pyridoxal phosphate enzyme, YggS family [Bacteroidetes bacterium OLB12]